MKPLNQNHIFVHKEGEEGIIALDGATGQIVSPVDERPDWADGLATALLSERSKFYTTRLGEQAAAPIIGAQAIAFQDLGWIGLDAEQNEMELEADPDFRAEMIATVLKLDRDPEAMADADRFGKTLATIETDREPVTHTDEQAQAFDEAQLRGMAGSTSVEVETEGHAKATGG